MGRARLSERSSVQDRSIDEALRNAHPLRAGDLSGYDPLLELVGDARIVLIGEASHGSHEFYRERALITTRLIEELGFSLVAVEGDWPECNRVNRYVRGGLGSATQALEAFSVYPTWMWGNLDVLHFVQWLRAYNDSLPPEQPRVGFYGLDLYSLFASVDAVVRYLESVDPEAGRQAREQYACFEPFSGNKDVYGYSAGRGILESCEDAVLQMLQQLLAKRWELEQISPDDTYFDALMNAQVTRDSERYYRSMYRSDEDSWNLRDTHMMDTLQRLLDHFGPTSRAVVWEHNTHIGDFRATADAHGMVNVGQLTRERYPDQSIAIGFGTYQGSVTASRSWGGRPEHMAVPPAQDGSYDSIFHGLETERFLLRLKTLKEHEQVDGLNQWRGQRAIGVVYHPEYEAGNYVPTRLADRYDAYIHIDHTRAVKPLAIEPRWTPPPLDQTYPTGY